MKNWFVIHPFLFAIFPILFLFSHNLGEVSFSEILLPSAIVLGFTLLILLLGSAILKDSKKAGIIVSLFLVLFFSYGHVYDMVLYHQIGDFTIDRHGYLLVPWGMLFACGVYLTIRTRRNLHNFTTALNIVTLFLVIVSLFNIGVYNFKTKSYLERDNKITEDSAITIIDLSNATTYPDIYYIILDGYASSNTLKEIYDYDNHEFTDYLTEKGFYIAYESRSNYESTFLSLASSLNMEYINYLTGIVGVESKDRRLPYQMIKDSKVMKFLKSKGYKFIHFGSGWGPTNSNSYADLDVRCGRKNEFVMVLIQTTMLYPFESFLIESDSRERVLCTFSKLAEVPKIEGSKFVFAHILCPHPPYLFDANGEPIPEAKLKMEGLVWTQKENYLNQLTFVNKKVEILVDQIISESKVPPIIILQADHGSASTFLDSGVWDRPNETNLRERLSIFNAYYLPSDGDDLLYDSITPVNTFRLIINFYFDIQYELLDDQSYYSTYNRPYEFINVTDTVKYD